KPLSLCPVCQTRVLPTIDGTCPCCRRFNFDTETANLPPAGAPVLGPSSLRPPVDLYAAALLHWRLIGLIAAFLTVVVLRAYMRGGDSLVDPREGDPGLQKLRVRVVGLVVATWLPMTSRQVAKLLGLRGWWNFWVVARESTAFFEERGVPSFFLGPNLRNLRPSEPEGESPKVS